jgi:hypothetical protein
MVNALVNVLGAAQAWVLSPEEADRLQALVGKETMSQLACGFSCGASYAIDNVPRHYGLYGYANRKFERRPSPMEYLNRQERLHYIINQYVCVDLKALKEKILQFPVGSGFEFTYEFTAADREEMVEIATFLRSHGYTVGNPQEWSFLQPDPPR